ncbi:FxsA family protein [Kribbella sp. NPDC048915]|uniref:FxsA family protein n=1 Tax=Kribbella sp. NPDC048915 TaxID=3155148 RepID=UPI003409239A
MGWLIGLALLVVPIVEIYVIIQVGQVIGGWPTVALLVAESALGAWLVKREGRRAWNALQNSLQTGKLPGRELTDGALVLIGGTLLLTPGFVSDVFGFFFILPFTRPLARRLVTRFVSRRATTLTPPAFTPFIPNPGADPGAGNRRPPSGDVIQGEVIDPDK